MKLTLAHLLLLATVCLSLSLPSLLARSAPRSLAQRAAAPEPEPVLTDDDVAYIGALPNELQADAYYALVKRKGGGGGKGGGSSSGGSKSGSSSSGGSSGSSGGTRSPTSSFTNASPSLGGGKSYPGGATSSYKAGGLSPGGIRPGLIGAGAFGLGVGGALYLYSYPHYYPYYRNTSTNRNDSLPVDCLCDQNQPCGCDDTNNPALVQEMLQNSSIAKIQVVNGTRTVVINGSLANGTVDTSAAGGSFADLRHATNWGVVAALVAGMMWAL